ncbi:hypothetical protein DICSQDRAFT_66203, partial [Dichomitus squalens LYAD-421 SS1]
SKGSVTLPSAPPFDPPVNDPAFLNSTSDGYLMGGAIRAAVRFVSKKTQDGFVTGQANGFANVDLDEDKDVDA